MCCVYIMIYILLYYIYICLDSVNIQINVIIIYLLFSFYRSFFSFSFFQFPPSSFIISVCLFFSQYINIHIQIQRDWASTDRRLSRGLGIPAVNSSGGTYGRLVDSGVRMKQTPKYMKRNHNQNLGSHNSCNSSLSYSSLGDGDKYSSHYHSHQNDSHLDNNETVGSNGSVGSYKEYKANKVAQKAAELNSSSSSSSFVSSSSSSSFMHIKDKEGIRGGGYFQDVTHVIHARKLQDLDFKRIICWISSGYGLQSQQGTLEEVWDFHLMKSPEFQQAIYETYDENKNY